VVLRLEVAPKACLIGSLKERQPVSVDLMQRGVESFHLVEDRKVHHHRLPLFMWSDALTPVINQGRVSLGDI
jgi:hypothetical protein